MQKSFNLRYKPAFNSFVSLLNKRIFPSHSFLRYKGWNLYPGAKNEKCSDSSRLMPGSQSTNNILLFFRVISKLSATLEFSPFDNIFYVLMSPIKTTYNFA